jgi:hypothetical protein
VTSGVLFLAMAFCAARVSSRQENTSPPNVIAGAL